MINSCAPSQFGTTGKIKQVDRRISTRVLRLRLAIRFSGKLIVKCSSGVVRGIAALLAWWTCLSAQAGEYCLRPDKEDGTQANSVVCCSTPAGWQGWKDDPHYWDDVKGFNKQLLESAHRMSVSFIQSNCKHGSDCGRLVLQSWGRDGRGQPDVKQGMRDFVRQVRQHQNVREHADPIVIRFGSFDAGDSGRLTIWQIRSSFCNDYFLTTIAQRDVLVTIYLEAADSKDIASKLDSLKELARSVRITAANLASPDIIKVEVVRLSDQAIRQQLLQLTPLGDSKEKVYAFLQSHLYKDSIGPTFPGELRCDDGDLWTQIGSYSSVVARQKPPPKEYRPPTAEEIREHISDHPTLPPTIAVRAFWKFDKQGKLRDIEIRREAVEFKPKE